MSTPRGNKGYLGPAGRRKAGAGLPYAKPAFLGQCRPSLCKAGLPWAVPAVPMQDQSPLGSASGPYARPALHGQYRPSLCMAGTLCVRPALLCARLCWLSIWASPACPALLFVWHIHNPPDVGTNVPPHVRMSTN